MITNNNRITFHIDVNSAYLSWEAAYRLQHGEKTDLREIPSVVGGDPKKMWPLPIGDLFMVGPSTEPKLKKIGINTIGDLASADLTLIKYRLKSHGEMIWKYANGIEDSSVRVANYMTMKGIGNSIK